MVIPMAYRVIYAPIRKRGEKIMQQYNIGASVILKSLIDVISMAHQTCDPDVYIIRGVTIRPEMHTLFNRIHTIQDVYLDNMYRIDNWILPEEVIAGEVTDIKITGMEPMEHNNPLTVKIKYFTDKIEHLKLIDDKSDWIDLRAAETITLKAGEYKMIPLGVAMKLPDGYEAHIVPRSSTFKHFGILQTNHQGVIDNSYSGDNDQWMFPALAVRDTVIHINDRICQFRIMKKQPAFIFEEVSYLDSTDRGGFGSTGKQ